MDAFVAGDVGGRRPPGSARDYKLAPFVNIHVSETTMTRRGTPANGARRLCGSRSRRLARRTRGCKPVPELRAESLKFLIHFVGDMHQPLHTLDNKDRGGNDVKVEALRGEDGRATTLHGAWDTGLINLSDETEAARAKRLLIDAPVVSDLDVVRWAEGNHDLATQVVYHYPGFTPAGPPATAITLAAAYRDAAVKAIDRQLQLGGARLAALLTSLIGAAAVQPR